MTTTDFNIKYKQLKKLPLYSKVGLECDMGWFEILYDLGQKIMSYCDHQNIEYPQIIQIKEKMGTLRYYFKPFSEESHTKTVRVWVAIAESESKTKCEACGKKGELVVTGGRWHVACKSHQKNNSMSADEYISKQKEMRSKNNGNV